MTVTRKNHGRGAHSYEIDGRKVPGVTTILGEAMAKPALINWAGNATAAYAVDNWAALGKLPPSARLDRLKGGRYEDRDAAGRRGTEVHGLAERLVKGEEVEVPDELAGHVESYVDFLNTWEPEPLLVEAVIANRAVGYCGTLDLVATMAGETWLLDVKTARSGIFESDALQMCAYAHAETYLDVGSDDERNPPGDELPFPKVDRCAAIHVRADGWDLRPVEFGEDVWSYFRHLAWIARHLPDTKSWVGPALDRERVVS